MSARLATSDGIVEIEADERDEVTQPVDVGGVDLEAAIMRGISNTEEATIERIAAGFDRRNAPKAAAFVRGRLWDDTLAREVRRG